MNILLQSKKIGSIFVTMLQQALRDLGHDVIRSSRENPRTKRQVFNTDQEAIGKIQQFVNFQERGVSHVPHTVNKAEAASWAAEGDMVVCRTLTNAHSGEGIVLAESVDQVVDAPLYTKYIKKFSEFRVHVFYGKIIFIQQKKAASGNTEVNYKIRNHQNGWVFCHNDLEIPDEIQLRSVAVAALRAVGYKFGAVDVIYNKRNNKYYVLEVNSRPGIEGATSIAYATALVNKLEQKEPDPNAIALIEPCAEWEQRCAEMHVDVFQITERVNIEQLLRAVAFAYSKGYRNPADAELGLFHTSDETIELYVEAANRINSYLAEYEGE